VRVSGPAAFRILEALSPARTDPPPARTQVLVAVHHPESGELLDRALVSIFPGPRSYTGEDVVELATHGGPLTSQLVLSAAYAAGARPALPGEFTRRAVFNGKLDLLQAEAVVDLIDGRSPALHRAAIHQIERGLSRRIDELRAAILRAEALISYDIDFPEEDEPPVAREVIRQATADALERIEQLVRTSPQGEMLRSGALVVLAGYPNSGKSSLFNALLGIDRAIVTEIPGTTRDAVEAEATIGGYPFRLTDTAGLREATDRVEALGVEVARLYLAAADVVLFCSEAGRSLEEGERSFLLEHAGRQLVLVRTKADLAPGAPDSAGAGDFPVVRVSSVSGEGLDALGDLLVNRAFGAIRGESLDAPIVTSERHRRALIAAAGELRSFLGALAADLPPELAATHLQMAVRSLENLIGAVSPDDVLAEIFGRFCVGK
jgi:tRNA modification GTPase